jgi:hypothetical protein
MVLLDRQLLLFFLDLLSRLLLIYTRLLQKASSVADLSLSIRRRYLLSTVAVRLSRVSRWSGEWRVM